MRALTHAQARDLLFSEKSEILKDGEQLALQQHLKDCAECREWAAIHRTLGAVLRRAGPSLAGDPQIDAALAAIQYRSRRGRMIRRMRSTFRAVAVISLVLLGVVLVLSFWQDNRLMPGSGQTTPTPLGEFLPDGESPAHTLEPSTPVQINGSSTPTTAQLEIITYTVKTGDTIFSLADRFNLTPETVLWSNYDTLVDNPNLLSPGQVLVIPPVDGVYYLWQPGDTLDSVAGRFNVDPQTILDYPGNRVALGGVGASNSSLEPGTGLMIPGGRREFTNWATPVR